MKDLTPSDYETIGRYVVGQSHLYMNAIEKHSELVHLSNENESEIHKEEAKSDKDMQKLSKLYTEYRQLKADLFANRSFRQNLCDKMLTRVNEVVHPESYQNGTTIEDLKNEE